jgi:hypothetical protein
VFEPKGFHHAQISGTIHYPTNTAGAGMTNTVWVGPTNVSFYRVVLEEVGLMATNATGYFSPTNGYPTNLLDHAQHGANTPIFLNQNNTWTDKASSSEASPYSNGNFTWPIPWRWQVGTSGPTNYIPDNPAVEQNFTIDSSGTVTIDKFNHSVTRTINDNITTK